MMRDSRSNRSRDRRRARCVAACLVAIALGSAGSGTAAEPSERGTPPPVSGRRLSAPESIRPADVLARVELLRAHVDLLRRYMGKPEPRAPLMRVKSARPAEVYSQALNLELRANRLVFEETRAVRNQTIPASREALPADVFAVVDSALLAVMMVNESLGIDEVVAEQARPDATTPSEVFAAVAAAGTEIDNLLDQRTSPSDVYQLVTAGVHTAASLHVGIPNGPNMPSEPEFVPNKMPRDVLERLMVCFGLISQLAQARGGTTLQLELGDLDSLQVSPNDVSDMASLVDEELNDLHRLFPDAGTPTRAYYPGRRFPSHVFQRAGLLELILRDLADAYVTKAPTEPAS